MPFLLLFVLTLSCFQTQWPEPPLGLVGSALLTWSGVAVFAAISFIASRRLERELRRDTSRQSEIVRRFARFRRYFVYGLITFFVLALYFLGWDRIGGEVMPGRELALLSPLIAALLLAWAIFHPLDKALHDAVMSTGDPPFPGRAAYVALQARHSFLLVLPLLLLLFIQESAVALFPRLKDDKAVMSVLGALLVFSAFIGFPLLLRLVLGLKRLPDSPLRDRLMATARRLNFRFTDILLWNTRGTIANAMVTGTVPFLRYVVLSDRLIQDLDTDEVEAVFGHEVGHVKHHHMFFYLGFLLMSLLVLGVAWEGLKDLIGLKESMDAGLLNSGIVTDLPMLLLLGIYIVVVFGFLSRRCERQADVYGCRTVSTPVFIEALEKVARINGIHREKPGWLSSWQHSTIARRVEFLQRAHSDPIQERSFQIRLCVLKFATLFVLAGILSGLWILLPEKVWALVQGTQETQAPLQRGERQ